MMKTTLPFLFAILTMAWVAQVAAEDLKSRQVQGGDLIYSATAVGATQEEAIFKAESQAVRMIVIECAIPHRDTKVFDFKLKNAGDKFVAQVSAGLTLEACAEGRNATEDKRTALTNPVLESGQHVYQQILETGKTQPAKTVAVKPVEYPIYVQPVYSQQFLQSYNRYLASQVDKREQAREELAAKAINKGGPHLLVAPLRHAHWTGRRAPLRCRMSRCRI